MHTHIHTRMRTHAHAHICMNTTTPTHTSSYSTVEAFVESGAYTKTMLSRTYTHVLVFRNISHVCVCVYVFGAVTQNVDVYNSADRTLI